MLKKLKSISKEKYWGYIILSLRLLLAFTFISYGYSKIAGTQFGVSPEVLNTPLKDLDLFKVAWHVFDHQPFKAFIGISQLICGVLLLINRTVLLGAFLFLPIAVVILVVDLTIMPKNTAIAFTWRLSFYILFDILIMLHYKSRLKAIWNNLWSRSKAKFKYPKWSYLLLPLVAISIEILSAIPQIIIYFINNPTYTLNYISNIVNSIF